MSNSFKENEIRKEGIDMKKIVANFESVDLATMAVNHIKSRVEGVDGAKVSYQNQRELDSDNDVFSDFFIPTPLQNGIMVNETVSYPVNFNAVREKRQEIDDYSPERVKIEIRTTDANVRNIVSNLRCYGALDVRVIENI